MNKIKTSVSGWTRYVAFDLWRGPDFLKTRDEEEPFGGGCLLYLALREGETGQRLQIESRAIYSNFVERQAVLRAVYWDNQVVRLDGRRMDLPIPVVKQVPARFVQVPMIQVQQWLDAFRDIETPILVEPQEGALPICTLRITLSHVASVFEKVWEVTPGSTSPLQQAWNEVWQQLGEALRTSPALALTDIEESFPNVEPKPEAYELQNYVPTMTLP